jgi:hypothetical protein
MHEFMIMLNHDILSFLHEVRRPLESGKGVLGTPSVLTDCQVHRIISLYDLKFLVLFRLQYGN